MAPELDLKCGGETTKGCGAGEGTGKGRAPDGKPTADGALRYMVFLLNRLLVSMAVYSSCS